MCENGKGLKRYGQSTVAVGCWQDNIFQNHWLPEVATLCKQKMCNQSLEGIDSHIFGASETCMYTAMSEGLAEMQVLSQEVWVGDR